MKLSVEAKVAASIAAGFVALTVGVIAQGNSGDQSAGPHGYGPTNNPEVGHMSQQGYNSLTPGHANTEEDEQWLRTSL
jgi:hypothetical protein